MLLEKSMIQHVSPQSDLGFGRWLQPDQWDLAQGQLRAFKRMPLKVETKTHQRQRNQWVTNIRENRFQSPRFRAANVGFGKLNLQAAGVNHCFGVVWQQSLEAIAMALTFVGVILGIFALAKSECLGVGRVYSKSDKTFGAPSSTGTLRYDLVLCPLVTH